MGLCLMRMLFWRICCAGMMKVRAMYRFFDRPSMYFLPSVVTIYASLPTLTPTEIAVWRLVSGTAITTSIIFSRHGSDAS